MYYLMMPPLEKRQGLISFLKSRGILGVSHDVPLYLPPRVQEMDGQESNCLASEEKSEHLARLPLYNRLNRDDQNKVIPTVKDFHV